MAWTTPESVVETLPARTAFFDLDDTPVFLMPKPDARPDVIGMSSLDWWPPRGVALNADGYYSYSVSRDGLRNNGKGIDKSQFVWLLKQLRIKQ